MRSVSRLYLNGCGGFTIGEVKSDGYFGGTGLRIVTFEGVSDGVGGGSAVGGGGGVESGSA